MLSLDLINTVAFGGVVLFFGHGVRRVVPALSRYNVPAPVIGGLIVAAAVLLARQRGVTVLSFDTTLQAPLQIAFFTTVGLGASVSLLRVGGPQVLVLLLVSSLLAVVQNAVGILMSIPMGLHPLFGVINGSVTLAGGPATGLAFAPAFEQAGVRGAGTVAIAAAMTGIVAAGVLGGPIGTMIIERYRLRAAHVDPPASAVADGDAPAHADAFAARRRVEAPLAVAERPRAVVAASTIATSQTLLKSTVVILAAMWLGSLVSAWVRARGVTLPAYIGAMIVAAVIRNLDDATGWIGLTQKTIDDVGSIALALFLVLALMTLRLWELAGLALPMVAILAVQIVVIAVVCWPAFRIMGRDYDAAVISSGFCGYMLGTTANAMANMEALVERYGPAPRAFLVVPMVGAFFIDFVNAVLITVCLNIWS